jgi:dTDP-4-amino-4,6-dideoxygalactose transaminase
MPLRTIPAVASTVAPVALLRAWGAAVRGTGAHAALAGALRCRFRADAVWLTDSGTSALGVALRLAGASGPVAMPGFACVDLVTAAVWAGTRLRLFDVEPTTLAPDAESVRTALQRGAAALVVAPLFGYPCDLPALRTAAHEAGALFIEDAAQCAAARWHGELVGTFGDFTVLSFGRGKGATGGGGGALLARGEGARRLESVATLQAGGRGFGDAVRATAQLALGRPALYAIPAALPFLRLGETVYHPPHEPRAISAAAATLALDALARVDREADDRRRRATLLVEQLCAARAAVEPILPLAGGTAGYLRLPILPTGAVSPQPRLGVLRSYPQALDETPEAKPLVVMGEAAGPGSRLLASQLLTAPTHQHVTASDAARIAAAFSPRAEPTFAARAGE